MGEDTFLSTLRHGFYGEKDKDTVNEQTKYGKKFPGMRSSDYSITSPATPEYNCIAWAAGNTEAWWWPDRNSLYYWPPEIPRTETLQAFIQAYELLGYTLCEDVDYEKGLEKIVLYADSNRKPTHAARQLSSGYWTSKLGQLEDIEHSTLDSLTGLYYGSIAIFMKRPIKGTP
jgi:hypothetical protein